MSDIGERVKAIVAEHLAVDPAKMVDSASFIDDLGADLLKKNFVARLQTMMHRRF
jgi:acyl carrier protein